MNTVKQIKKIGEIEMQTGTGTSWHDEYRKSSYIFISNLNYGMNEGDIAIVFSQFGEIVDVYLVRDKVTGKSRGFCFLAYEDQQSTVLAIDNFNHAEICGRLLRVDHVKEFKPPKEYLDIQADDPEIFNKLYKPTGPDGKGWGDFRQLTEQELKIKQQIETQEQEKSRKNEQLYQNMQELKNMQGIVDEDERWDKMLMIEDEKKELQEKLEALQYFNQKMGKYKIINESPQETNEQRLKRIQEKEIRKKEKKIKKKSKQKKDKTKKSKKHK